MFKTKFLIFVVFSTLFVSCYDVVVFDKDDYLNSLEIRFACKVFSSQTNEPLKNSTVWVSLETPNFSEVLTYDVTDSLGSFDFILTIPSYYLKYLNSDVFLNISKGGYEFYKQKISELIPLPHLPNKNFFVKDFTLTPSVDTIPPFVVSLDTTRFYRNSYEINIIFSEEVNLNDYLSNVSVGFRRHNPCDPKDSNLVFDIFPNNPKNFVFYYKSNRLTIKHPQYDSVTCRIVRFNYHLDYPTFPDWYLHFISLENGITDFYNNKLITFYRKF